MPQGRVRAALAAMSIWATANGCSAGPDPEPAHTRARERMVRDQIEARGVRDPRVLAAMRHVRRHRFVPEALAAEAYDDHPLPIGSGQTISQPYVVAFMTELLRIEKGARVLEIGTGSGYQAAVLAELGARVWSIEIVEALAQQAGQTLAAEGYEVAVRAGDGYQGWPEHAPFDAIIVTAAPPAIPEPLKQQLKIGGRLVVPEGDAEQQLVVLTRTAKGFERHESLPVRFVPMTGEAQRPKPHPSPTPAE